MMELDQLRDKFDNSPYAVYMGMKIEELSRGYARVNMKMREEFLNWDGMVHGGVISSLIDQAFGNSLNTLENVYIAVQLNVNFISAPSVDDTIYAESKVVRAGRSVGITEMTASDSKGKVIAKATGTTVSMGPRKQVE
ncbi:PaaI family thioesterase [Chloroflexota bacterium]